MITKTEAIAELESRGVFVPKAWKADKVREVLAEILEDESAPKVQTSDAAAPRRYGTVSAGYRSPTRVAASPRG